MLEPAWLKLWLSKEDQGTTITRDSANLNGLKQIYLSLTLRVHQGLVGLPRLHSGTQSKGATSSWHISWTEPVSWHTGKGNDKDSLAQSLCTEVTQITSTNTSVANQVTDISSSPGRGTEYGWTIISSAWSPFSSSDPLKKKYPSQSQNLSHSISTVGPSAAVSSAPSAHRAERKRSLEPFLLQDAHPGPSSHPVQ